MSEYKDVFQRYEKKYLLSAEQYHGLMQAIRGRLERDAFYESTICNIYFDTPDHRLIRDSLEKPVYKEKLRLRSYNVPGDGDTVFVELKKKFKGVTYKRRVPMKHGEAVQYLSGERAGDGQICSEIDWMMKCYPGIRPSMFISYDRKAFRGVEDDALRITFDSRILWRDEELDLTRGAWGESLLEPGQRVMEIKMADAMPLWLADALDVQSIYPTSYSKYGGAYKEYIAGMRARAKGGVICA